MIVSLQGTSAAYLLLIQGGELYGLPEAKKYTENIRNYTELYGKYTELYGRFPMRRLKRT